MRTPAALAGYVANVRQLHTDARRFLVSWFLFWFSYWSITLVLQNLFLLRLGYGTEFIGAVNGMRAGATALAAFPAGLLGAVLGAGRGIRAGLITTFIGYALFPIGDLLGATANSWFLGTALLSGVGFGLFNVNTWPYLTRLTTVGNRSEVFSILAALIPLAAFVGSTLAGLLTSGLAIILQEPSASPIPFRYLLFAEAIVVLVAVVLVRDRQPISNPLPRPASGRRSTPLLLIAVFSMVGILRVAGEGSAQTFLNVYLDKGLGLTPAAIGSLSGIAQLAAVPAALAAAILMRRFGKTKTFVGASLATAGAVALLPLVPHWIAAGLFFMVSMGAAAISRPTYLLVSQEIVRPQLREVMSGATITATGVSLAGVGLVGGFLISKLGLGSVFVAGGLLTAVGAVVFLLAVPTRRSTDELEEPEVSSS